jgi:deoxyribodipyrimidine photo-lyase
VGLENAAWLAAWQRGRTGYPIVDAGMRELWQTGWMHNRVRMIVASLLTKNLQQPWLAGARWFWDTLVDADLAANTLGWQWTAGCGADAAPFSGSSTRAAGRTARPGPAYIRRWVPELARMPDAYIHRPWLAPAAVLDEAGVTLGATYPAPIVDFPATAVPHWRHTVSFARWPARNRDLGRDVTTGQGSRRGRGFHVLVAGSRGPRQSDSATAWSTP